MISEEQPILARLSALASRELSLRAETTNMIGPENPWDLNSCLSRQDVVTQHAQVLCF